MAKTIDMQFMRYINLFHKFTGIYTTNCFNYNNFLFFAVPSGMVSKAIGKSGINIRDISKVLRKRVRVIEMPSDIKNLEKFIKDLTSPIEFNSFELKDNEVTIKSDMQGRSMLIGRNRIREKELLEILNRNFGIEKVKIC
jgi:NusA-like KH domain protein